jgi:N-acetylglucosaminyldiphosphoundecaprenol N-acetyl-beta-D-mannosaminyltransferase
MLSTANLNFLVGSLEDPTLRESLLKSSLCLADGMPIVLLGRMLGARVPERLAGSDLFERLKAGRSEPPMNVFFFGGSEKAAELACASLNRENGGLRCVGWHDPGFGDVAEMSADEIISKINASGADLLSVSLGAHKGQAWLLRNHHRVSVPVRVHLGATINFQIGRVKRAPVMLRAVGLEWLWRIKEEPHLWRRYWRDGCKLLSLLITRALPLLLKECGARLRPQKQNLEIGLSSKGEELVIALRGSATARNVPAAVPILREATATKRPFVLDLANVVHVDSRFIGLLLMARKEAGETGMRIVNVRRAIRRTLSLNGFAYLLDEGC